jgi:pseudaminic acid synthase
VEDIAAGELISTNNVRSIRPGFGMHPKRLKEFRGTIASKAYKKGDRFLG